MQRQKFFRYLLGAVLVLAFIALACNTFNSLGGVKETAESVGTVVEGGMQVMETGQAVTTDIDMGGMVTQIGGVVTEMGGIITEISGGGGLPIPGFSGGDGEKPEDIPVMTNAEDESSGSNMVSYLTASSVSEAVDFYNREMPNNGWTKTDEETPGEGTRMKFEKGDRKAMVEIFPAMMFQGKTRVQIMIQGDS